MIKILKMILAKLLLAVIAVCVLLGVLALVLHAIVTQQGIDSRTYYDAETGRMRYMQEVRGEN